MDNRLSEDLRTMNFTSEYSLSDDFKLNAGGRYDLNNSKMAKTSFGLSFDRCLGIQIYSRLFKTRSR